MSITTTCPMCHGNGCGRCDDGQMPVRQATKLTREMYAPKNKRKRLSAEEVRQIRELADDHTYRQLGARFGCAPSTVGQIVRGEIRSEV